LERAGEGLQKIVADALRRAPAGEAPLLAWPLACGAAVAERTRALDFTAGVLRVEVPDSAWRAELQQLMPRYLTVLNRYAGEKVKTITFVVVKQQ
jgi:predicted nucleic acid-binding Zn ribbon protein